MPNNQAATLKIKNNARTYNALYPTTTKEQVVGWNIGEVNGSFVLTLRADAWQGNRQTVALEGVSSADVLDCNKVLSGTKEQMIAQAEAYDGLNHVQGVQSQNNQVLFVCDKVPQVDIQVQISWTR